MTSCCDWLPSGHAAKSLHRALELGNVASGIYATINWTNEKLSRKMQTCTIDEFGCCSFDVYLERCPDP